MTPLEVAVSESAPEVVGTPDGMSESNIVLLFADARGPLFAEARGEDPEAYRLECAIKRVRTLLDDPVALRRRAQALLNGTARPLLTVAIIGLVAFRLVAGPPSVPSFYLHGAQHRRAAVVAAVVEDRRGAFA